MGATLPTKSESDKTNELMKNVRSGVTRDSPSPHLSALGLGRLEEPYRCLRAEHTSLVFFFARARPPRETSSFNEKKVKEKRFAEISLLLTLKFNKILLDEKKGVGVVPQSGGSGENRKKRKERRKRRKRRRKIQGEDRRN